MYSAEQAALRESGPKRLFFDALTGHYNYYRDYDPSIGRFIQSDPFGLLAGQNTYWYANASPVTWADAFGLYAGDGHSNMTRDALQGEKCIDVDDLAMRTQNVDYEHGSQRPENAYKHAMRNGASGQSAADAQRQYNDYVATQLSKCTLDGLAHALHAVQDSTASGHAGFQPWDGGVPSPAHMKGDFAPSNANWEAGKQKTRDLIDQYKKKCGCTCLLNGGGRG